MIPNSIIAFMLVNNVHVCTSLIMVGMYFAFTPSSFLLIGQ
jgi:hypothetical protein